MEPDGMKKIRACIGSNDGDNIAQTHMGDTEHFFIYDLFENAENRFIENRVNAAMDMEHAKEQKMETIMGIVEDADIFVACRKSPNFVKIANKTRHQPVLVEARTLPEALALLQASFQEIHGYVSRRKQGEVFGFIPELK